MQNNMVKLKMFSLPVMLIEPLALDGAGYMDPFCTQVNSALDTPRNELSLDMN